MRQITTRLFTLLSLIFPLRLTLRCLIRARKVVCRNYPWECNRGDADKPKKVFCIKHMMRDWLWTEALIEESVYFNSQSQQAFSKAFRCCQSSPLASLIISRGECAGKLFGISIINHLCLTHSSYFAEEVWKGTVCKRANSLENNGNDFVYFSGWQPWYFGLENTHILTHEDIRAKPS